MKKFLAIILMIAIMASSSVVIHADDTVLTLNTTKTVSLMVTEGIYDVSRIYTFKPTESAYYWFISSNQSENADPYAQIYSDSALSDQIATGDDTETEIYDRNFSFCAYLKANTTYYLKACVYYVESLGTQTYDIIVKKATTPSSISINVDDTYEGFVGNSDAFTFKTEPELSMADVVWTSSNTSIAKINSSTGEIDFVSKGTVTITATGAGLSDEITFEVKDATSIEIDNGDSVGYKGESFYFSYTLNPQMVKRDVTWTFGDTSLVSNVEYVSDLGYGYCFGTFVKTGKTTLTVTADNGLSDTINLTVDELKTPTAVSLGADKTVELGEYIVLEYTLTPSNSKTNSTWTSSNSSVINTDYAYGENTYGKGSVSLIASSVGSTDITVTTEEGLKDTVKITVVEPECTEITTALDVECTFNSNIDEQILKFVPEQSGIYVFEASDDTFNSYVELYNKSMEYIKSDDNSGYGLSFRLGHQMNKGESYYLKLSSINSVGTINVSVKKSQYPSSISINEEILADVRLGDQISLQYAFNPTSAYADIMWETDNTDVAIVYGEGILVAHGLGSVNITVSAMYSVESGLQTLTDTVTIEVKEPNAQNISLNSEVKVNTVEDEISLYKFTPSTSGNYVIYTNDVSSLGADISLYDSSMHNLQEICMQRSDGAVALGSTLEKGNTYYFGISSKVEGEITLKLVAATAVESIEIFDSEDIVAQVNNRFKLKYEFSPISSYEQIKWNTDENNIVDISGGFIEFWKEGSAVITATTASGKTALANVEVIGNREIGISTGLDVEIAPNDGDNTNTSWTMEFTVPADGSYCIRTENLTEFTASLTEITTDSDFETESIFGTANFLKDLKKGQKYIIGMHNTSDSTISDTFRIDMLGDVDGSLGITARDITLVKRYLADGWNVDMNEYAADITGDDKISPKDATMLARMYAGGWFDSFIEIRG